MSNPLVKKIKHLKGLERAKVIHDYFTEHDPYYRSQNETGEPSVFFSVGDENPYFWDGRQLTAMPDGILNIEYENDDSAFSLSVGDEHPYWGKLAPVPDGILKTEIPKWNQSFSLPVRILDS